MNVRTMGRLALLSLACAASACADPDADLPQGVSILESPDFGRVFVGDSLRRTLRIRNSIVPGRDLRVSSSVLDIGTVFVRRGAHPPPGVTVAAGDGLDLDFLFRPPQQGRFTTTWRLILNGQPFTRELSGEGVLAVGENLALREGRATPQSGLDFGSVPIGTSARERIVIRVVQDGTSARIAPPTIDRAGSGVFTITSAGVAGVPGTFDAPRVLQAGQSLVIIVSFNPPDTEAGHHTGTLEIADGSGRTVFRLFLRGDGIE